MIIVIIVIIIKMINIIIVVIMIMIINIIILVIMIMTLIRMRIEKTVGLQGEGRWAVAELETPLIRLGK